jgi:hypothetical protein
MRASAVGTVAAVAAGLLLVATAGAAQAGTASGTTTLVGAAVSGQPLTVTVSLKGVYPVVPYDFLLENRCWFGGRYAGPVSSTETYPLLGPWFAGASGSATSSQVVDLTPVPAGAVCKVAITRGSTPVKGSTTPYSVG